MEDIKIDDWLDYDKDMIHPVEVGELTLDNVFYDKSTGYIYQPNHIDDGCMVMVSLLAHSFRGTITPIKPGSGYRYNKDMIVSLIRDPDSFKAVLEKRLTEIAEAEKLAEAEKSIIEFELLSNCEESPEPLQDKETLVSIKE